MYSSGYGSVLRLIVVDTNFCTHDETIYKSTLNFKTHVIFVFLLFVLCTSLGEQDRSHERGEELATRVRPWYFSFPLFFFFPLAKIRRSSLSIVVFDSRSFFTFFLCFCFCFCFVCALNGNNVAVDEVYIYKSNKHNRKPKWRKYCRRSTVRVHKTVKLLHASALCIVEPFQVRMNKCIAKFIFII